MPVSGLPTGLDRKMKKWITTSALLVLGGMLGGCASQGCVSQAPGSACRVDRILYENDMLQAKLLIVAGDPQNDELTQALLQRAEHQDKSGESQFYQAVVLIRQHSELPPVLSLLKDSAQQGHPLAIVLLVQMYSQLSTIRDPAMAKQYRDSYDHLDVSKSGYPSYEKALGVVNSLVKLPETSTAQLQP